MVTGRLRQRSWETPEGDKRSVTEIEADEVGASLKWATAKVERINQRGNGERNSARAWARWWSRRSTPADLNWARTWLVARWGMEPFGGVRE